MMIDHRASPCSVVGLVSLLDRCGLL
jgi:hypothetical protein